MKHEFMGVNTSWIEGQVSEVQAPRLEFVAAFESSTPETVDYLITTIEALNKDLDENLRLSHTDPSVVAEVRCKRINVEVGTWLGLLRACAASVVEIEQETGTGDAHLEEISKKIVPIVANLSTVYILATLRDAH